MNANDIPKIAATIRQAGELLEAHGAVVFDITASWTPGPRSANLNGDNGGTRHEEVVFPEGPTVVPIPSDRTGEAAITEDEAAEHHAELLKLLRRTSTDAARIRDLVAQVVPPSALALPEPAEWCTNHLRIQVCEPRHRGDLCRFCYDFHQLHRQPPNPTLLGLRHRNGRVTERQVIEALASEDKHSKSVKAVADTIKRGRRTTPPVVASKPTPQEKTDPKADIEDRRTKRLRAS